MAWFRRSQKKPSDIFQEFNHQIPWLSDAQLGAMMEALESEAVNREARMAGYFDPELEIWVDTTQKELEK